MGEYLPGDMRERLRELREAHGYSTQQKLADALGIDKATYGRIENGTTKTLGSDLLIKLAKLYNVTTDFILGISDVPDKTYYDFADLGLSVEAAKNLYTNKVDRDVVNELLKNDQFAVATVMMKNYFCGIYTRAVVDSHALMDFSYGLLTEFQAIGSLPNDRSVEIIKQQILAKGNHVSDKYEMTRISSQFAATLRSCKKRISEEAKELGAGANVCSSEILQGMKREVGKIEEMVGLPEEEKQERVINSMKRVFAGLPDLTEGEKDSLMKLAETVGPVLQQLGSEMNCKQQKGKTEGIKSCAG